MNKLKAIEQAKLPTDVKTIQVGLCNFFWTHINEFVIIVALLSRLICNDCRYKGGLLPGPAMAAFLNLRNNSSQNLLWPSLTLTSNTLWSLILPPAWQTHLGYSEPSWHRWINTENSMPSWLYSDNWKTIRKINLCFCWKQLPQNGEWTNKMNI